MRLLRIGSLFSGIGGLELGLEQAGVGYVAWQVEADAYCRHVLGQHWPTALRFEDVRHVGHANLPHVDLVCGGFPCQDVSAAGRLVGLSGPRSGLWFEMERVVDECKPAWVVVENVAQTWGRWVPVVRDGLWRRGYASVPILLRAADVGARHERRRVFIVASTEAACRRLVAGLDAAPDDAGIRLAQRLHFGPDDGEEQPPAGGGAGGGDVAPGFGLPARPWMVRGVHGLPGGVDGAWAAAGWTGARLRQARIRMLGNAVVPSCSRRIGDLIVGAMA